MSSYQIAIQNFEGPLDKLLELVEARHLEITQISLSEVTADFLKYIETIDKNRPEVLAEFLPVAAKLLLIKSRTVLPNLELTEEETEEIKNLEYQLKEYKRFKEAAKMINDLWLINRISHGREFLAGLQFLNLENVSSTSNSFFYPPKKFDFGFCAETLKKLYREISLQTMPPAELIMKVINLEEKIKETFSKISSKMEQTFSSIVQTGDISDIIITFLAILHLFKEGKIIFSQNSHFGEIKLINTDYYGRQ